MATITMYNSQKDTFLKYYRTAMKSIRAVGVKGGILCLSFVSFFSCSAGNTALSQAEELPVASPRPPVTSHLQMREEHLLFPIAQSMINSDCTEVVSASETVWLNLVDEVREAVQGEATQGASSMRGLLNRYVHIETPVLKVGETRFIMTSWWFSGWVSCLIQLEQYDRAITMLEQRLMDLFEEETAYLLVVARFQLEGETSARSVLTWWEEVHGASELATDLLNQIASGETLPLTIQQHSLGLH